MALEAIQSLRRQEESALERERELSEQLAREERARQREAAAAFLSAFSSKQGAPEADTMPEGADPAEMPAAGLPLSEVPAEPASRPAPATVSPAADEPIQREARPAPGADGAPRPAVSAQTRVPRPVEGQRPYHRPEQGQPPYGRPVQPFAQRPQDGQRPFGRPVQGQPPFGRPVQPAGQGSFGRPAQGPPYGRPAYPAGQAEGSRPFGRPAAPGAAPGAQGQRRYGTRPVAAGGGFGRKATVELMPAVEKERVSNYDPNKKNYVRQNDPERIKANARRQARGSAGGLDDEFVRGKRKKKAQAGQYKPEPIKIEKAFMTAETVTVKDLSERIGKPSSEIIKKLLLLGVIATINEELEFDTAQLISNEFEVELEMKLDKTAEDVLSDKDFEDTETDLRPRNPVVTIMGHVDHGKTSLLDYIRKSRVTASEAGGITQHIGAYTVKVKAGSITFLDTPGHEAFTAMRARGAQVTDIAILVVAADDGVMPQTVEAINHAKVAGVPIIVAINKCDMPDANPDRVKQELTQYELLSEDWGGDTIMIDVSALTGRNIDSLLDMILLVAEMRDYRANPNRKARGAIIEAKLDKSRGPVATVLVQNGTLYVGDTIVAGTAYGRVRAMVDDKGVRVTEAGPSRPVEIIGFNDLPSAGDMISAVDDDKLSRQVAEERRDKQRAALYKSQGAKTSLDDLFGQIAAGQIKDLNIIVKADVQGSAEAVKQSLEKIANDEVRVRVIHSAAGAINESDVMLASVTGAIIIGFNVRHDSSLREIADREKVDIRLYRVIYNAIEDIEKAMKGLLAPTFKENILGRAQVRQTFRISGVGAIAGCYVLEGRIQRNAQVRLLRDNVVIYEGRIDSLKRFKDDAREVTSGFECGIGLVNYNDIKESDEIECFLVEEVER
jgi:translation initiation factor IF-2